MVGDRTGLLFGALDLLLAGLYLLLFIWVVPSRSSAFTVAAVLASAVAIAGGVGMVAAARPWGRRLAAVCSVVLLALCGLLILGLLSSAAYLHGIYGGIGEAATMIALCAAALAFELVGLVPALQLAHLRRLRRAHAPRADG